MGKKTNIQLWVSLLEILHSASDLCIMTLIPIFFIIINQLLISNPTRTICKVFEPQILVKSHSCKSSAINNKPQTNVT